MLYGGIEGGGTKMVCAVTDSSGVVTERVTIPTRTPEETVPQMLEFFKARDIASLGIGFFGPLELDRRSRAFGTVTTTPKPGWSGFDVIRAFSEPLGVPVTLDTDVNAAVLGEVKLGAAKGCDCAIYVTIGTGVGVGVYCNGGTLHGLVHPESGHISLQRVEGDTYKGRCPYHGSCMEGLASGPSIEERWGCKANLLTDRDEVWQLESEYIAQALCTYILAYSPQKIILWGGVMHQEQLFPLVREKVRRMLGGYVHHELITARTDEYIVPPALGDDAGITGAAMLGRAEAF